MFVLWPCPQHVEVPRLKLDSEFIKLSTPQPLQCRIWDASATYTTSQWQLWILNQLTRPGIKPRSSWILVGFITAKPWPGTPKWAFILILSLYSFFLPVTWCLQNESFIVYLNLSSVFSRRIGLLWPCILQL